VATTPSGTTGTARLGWGAAFDGVMLGLIALAFLFTAYEIGYSRGHDAGAGQRTGGPAQTTPSAADARGAFVTSCGGCHTLASAGTTGTTGPDLDACAGLAAPSGTCAIVPLTAAAVLAQIEHPRSPTMPAGILTGDAAKSVAAYVADNAGS
jgi:hypothetical protein